MKGFVMALIASLSVLFGNLAIASHSYHHNYKGEVEYSQDSWPSDFTVTDDMAYSDDDEEDCDDGACACAESSCGKNPCLEGQKCCRLFGNIGATRFDPL